MNAKTRRRYEAKAEIMKALSHPTRLFILDRLADGERCVGDLTVEVGGGISTISNHLLILRNAGIIAKEKRGMQVFYALRIPCVLDFFRCAEKVLLKNAADLVSSAE